VGWYHLEEIIHHERNRVGMEGGSKLKRAVVFNSS